MPNEYASDSPDAIDAALAASRALLAVVARSMADALENVTLPQYRILVVLCEWGPMRSGLLAERVGIHQSTLTRSADRLVDGGWIDRTVGAENRREVIVRLTEKGEDLVRDVMSKRRRELEHLLRPLSDRDRRAISRGLDILARAAGEPERRDLVTLGL